MASPFYLFRKYQKTFLVIAGVLAMFIFVLADPLMSWLQSSAGGGGPRSANTVLASWDGGSINAQELDSLTKRRYRLHEFLRNLQGIAAETIRQEGGTPQAPAVPSFLLPQNTNTEQVQQGCITTRLLAGLAEDSGISVSDEFINHYLKEWGLRKMGNAEIGTLLSRVGLREQTLFAGMRELLLGNFYINSFGSVTSGVMPEERWQDWKRINERVSVEAAILPTENFVAEVPEPSETELRQFYDQNKERIDGLPQYVMGASLPSPDPGFREPRRVRLQYLLGDVNEWTQRSLDKVTDEEIVDYYERNKRTQFVKSESDSLFGDDDGEDEAAETEATEDAESTDDAAEEASAEEEPEAEQPAEEASAEETATTEETAPEEEPAKVEEEEEEEESAEESADDVEAEEGASETATEAETTTEEETPAEDTVEEEEADAEDDTEEEKPVEYVPLDEVKDQIRRQLATEKAVVELKQVIDGIYPGMQLAFNKYGAEVFETENPEERPEPPAKLSDYATTAKETGLAHEKTTLLSRLELSETFVGKAFDAQTRREFVTQKAFRDLELYEPYLAQDLDGNWYLVCKTEDVASTVPPLEDVRDKVVSAWKEREAAKLALAKAQELATKAQESGDTVGAVCQGTGYKVVTTDMFSWLTFGTTPAEMQNGPRLGEAPPLASVGVDFMTKAFELEPDQKVAIQNHDLSQTYVMQLAQRQQTKEEMKQQFLSEANSWYGGRMMNSIRASNAQRQLIFELTEQVGLNLDNYQEYFSDDSEQ